DTGRYRGVGQPLRAPSRVHLRLPRTASHEAHPHLRRSHRDGRALRIRDRRPDPQRHSLTLPPAQISPRETPMPTTDFDLVITSATLVDGSGGERRDADIAVRDGFITRVDEKGSMRLAKADEVIDAAGHLVTPGFVDIH